MKAYDLTRSETIKEIQRIRKNLSARLKRIEGDENLPQFAVEGFKKLSKRVDFSKLGKLTDKELTTVLRDIKYISDLKSSNVLGAQYVQNVYIPIKQKLDALSPDLRASAWRAFESIQGETSKLVERFKYEIVGTATDYIYGAADNEDTIRDIISAFDDTYTKFNGDIDSEAARIHFTKKLDELRQQFK